MLGKLKWYATAGLAVVVLGAILLVTVLAGTVREEADIADGPEVEVVVPLPPGPEIQGAIPAIPLRTSDGPMSHVPADGITEDWIFEQIAPYVDQFRIYPQSLFSPGEPEFERDAIGGYKYTWIDWEIDEGEVSWEALDDHGSLLDFTALLMTMDQYGMRSGGPWAYSLLKKSLERNPTCDVQLQSIIVWYLGKR